MINKITLKGKSEEIAFNVNVPINELVTFITDAATAAEEELDIETATSPGGFPTALFTALLPAKARKAVCVREKLSPQAQAEAEKELSLLQDVRNVTPTAYTAENKARLEELADILEHGALVSWDITRHGWNAEAAKAAFAFRLERKSRKLTDEEKQERTAKALVTKQETWDAKNAALVAAGTPADVITLAIGTRPI